MKTDVATRDKWLNYRLAHGGQKSPEQLEYEAKEISERGKRLARTSMKDRWRNSSIEFQREAVAFAEKGYGWQDLVVKFNGVVTAEEARTLVLGG